MQKRIVRYASKGTTTVRIIEEQRMAPKMSKYKVQFYSTNHNEQSISSYFRFVADAGFNALVNEFNLLETAPPDVLEILSHMN